MKTKSFFTLFTAAIFLFASCEKPEAPDNGDDNTDPIEEVKFVSGTLVAKNNETEVVLRKGTSETRVFNYSFETDKAVETERTVTLAVDVTLVEDGKTLLPEANYSFTKEFKVDAGTDMSGIQTITFKADNLEKGQYVLPVVEIVPEGEQASEPLVYTVTVREPHAFKYRFADNIHAVLYINTDEYDPRIATDYILKNQRENSAESAPFIVGWIVNLRTATLQYKDGRAMLVLNDKLNEIFGAYDDYLLPVQDQGSKLCLTIEGGNTGLGFCNMSEEQMDDFVAQVADLVKTHNLDGINLWDQNSGYEKAASNGLPEVNTTSYPMLIRKLRESLGTGRLITLADEGEPTAYFYDKEAMGGIEVGTLLDYAWSVYTPAKNSESPVTDPYHPGGAGVSKDNIRKPILGLEPSKYGCVSVGLRFSSDHFATQDWKNAGLMQSDIVVLLETTPRLQNEFESNSNGAELVYQISRIYYDDVTALGLPIDQEMNRLRMYVPENQYGMPSGVNEMVLTGYGKWKWGWDDPFYTQIKPLLPEAYIIYVEGPDDYPING